MTLSGDNWVTEDEPCHSPREVQALRDRLAELEAENERLREHNDILSACHIDDVDQLATLTEQRDRVVEALRELSDDHREAISDPGWCNYCGFSFPCRVRGITDAALSTLPEEQEAAK